MSSSMLEMLEEMQGLVETSNLKKTTIQYFRDNFETIELAIELNNMYDITGETGLTAYKRIADFAFKDGVKSKDGSKLKEGFISYMLNKIRKERGLAKTKTVPLAVSSVIPDAPISSKVVVPQVPKATVPNSPAQVKPSNSSSSGGDAPKNLSNKEQARQFDWANANFGSPLFLYPEYLITTGDIVDKTIDQIRNELQEEYGYKDAPNLSRHMNDNELAEYMFNNRKSTLNYFSLHHTRYDQKTADVLCFLNHCCPGIMDKNWSGTFTFDNNEGTYKPSSISNLRGWLKNIRESFITNIKE